MKIRAMEAELFHVGGRTGSLEELTVALRNFANAPAGNRSPILHHPARNNSVTILTDLPRLPLHC
jgi:hypothetical protein